MNQNFQAVELAKILRLNTHKTVELDEAHNFIVKHMEGEQIQIPINSDASQFLPFPQCF